MAKIKNSTGLGSPYVVSGVVGNVGGSASNPIDVLITVTDKSNNTIFNMITSPDPNILQPGQNLPFSKEFTVNDFGTYTGPIYVHYTVIDASSAHRYSLVIPAHVQILEQHPIKTSGFFTVHYIESGRVVNSGGSASNPIVILISIKDDANNTLFTTTTSPEPSILQPGQEASFSREFSTSDLGGYSGQFFVYATVQQQ